MIVIKSASKKWIICHYCYFSEKKDFGFQSSVCNSCGDIIDDGFRH